MGHKGCGEKGIYDFDRGMGFMILTGGGGLINRGGQGEDFFQSGDERF